MGRPRTPMPTLQDFIPQALSTWVPFTHFPLLHVTPSLSRGCHHCQHCAGPIVFMAHVKGVVIMVTFQPRLTREGRNSVVCPPSTLQKSLPLCLFQEAVPTPPPLSTLTLSQRPLLCAPRAPSPLHLTGIVGSPLPPHAAGISKERG